LYHRLAHAGKKLSSGGVKLVGICSMTLVFERRLFLVIASSSCEARARQAARQPLFRPNLSNPLCAS